MEAGDESGMVRGPAAARGVSGDARPGGRATCRGPSILGRGARVRGRIGGEGDLRVEGAESRATWSSPGELSIEEGGAITGDVGAASVVVGGALQGRRRRARGGRPPRHGRGRGQKLRAAPRWRHRGGRLLPRAHRGRVRSPCLELADAARPRARGGRRARFPSCRDARGHPATILRGALERPATEKTRGARKTWQGTIIGHGITIEGEITLGRGGGRRRHRSAASSPPRVR